MAIRIRFDATLQTVSDQGEFPANTIRKVYVVNRDDCTFGEVDVSLGGELCVDVPMQSKKQGVRMTSRVKFHFYFEDDDKQLKPVCAGHVALTELADMASNGGVLTIKSNFTSNRVLMHIRGNAAHGIDMHMQLLELYKQDKIAPSVLDDSDRHNLNLDLLGDSITKGLNMHTNVLNKNGGGMFQNLKTAHIMQDEHTLYSLYHLDFDQVDRMPPPLCTYGLAETMQYLGITVDQLLSMSLVEKTDFLAAYSTFPMRSASAVPYTSDRTLNENPQKLALNRSMLSELFKRPFSLPNNGNNQMLHGSMMRDDCEGLALVPKTLTGHLKYLYRTYERVFRQSGSTRNLLEYNAFMATYFPPKLFGLMDRRHTYKLMDAAMQLGELVAKEVIDCHITIVSAGAPSADQTDTKSGEVQGHACACMICTDPTSHRVVILEGTACVVDEQQSKIVRTGDGKSITIANIANMLTASPNFNTFQQMQTRSGMHITHARGDFYRTAFCQNDILLGTHVEDDKPPIFGVDMEHVSNDRIKVYMPVQGAIFDGDEYEKLKEYVAARRAEIHPPLMEAEEVMDSLNWVPIPPFKAHPDGLANRRYTTCLVHVLASSNQSLDDLLARATEEADAFNADESNTMLGRMRAFPCMDGVSKVLYLYTDDTRELERRIGCVTLDG